MQAMSYVHGAHETPLIGETIGAYLDGVAADPQAARGTEGTDTAPGTKEAAEGRGKKELKTRRAGATDAEAAEGRPEAAGAKKGGPSGAGP